MTTARYLVRRLLALLPVWLCVSLLAFALGRAAPGDPAQIMLERQTGEPPSAEDLHRVRSELGLDDPLPLQYARWLGHALRGDLGRSYRTGEEVLAAIWARFPATLELAVAALLIGCATAVPVGILAAARRNSLFDRLQRIASIAAASMPSFWSGYLLILLFGVSLHWLPVSGRGGPRHLVLPALTLSAGFMASLARLTRATLLEELSQDYVLTARAKGLSRRAVILRHALRNALIPLVTFTGTRFAVLLGGAAIVETVFAWPGVGKQVLDSIFDRDYPAIQGFVLVMGTVFVGLSLVVDLSYRLLDPRVSLAPGRGAHG